MRAFMSFCLAVAIFTGCKSSEPVDPEMDKLGRATGPVTPGAAPPGMGKGMPPGMMGKGAPPGMGKVHRGTVLEAISASRYTYVHLKPASGEPVWAAIPQTKLEKGTQIAIVESIVMKNFESPTLKRTFPTVVFGVMEGQKLPAGMGSMPPAMGKGMPPGGGMPPGHPPLERNAQEGAGDGGPEKAAPAEAAPVEQAPAKAPATTTSPAPDKS